MELQVIQGLCVVGAPVLDKVGQHSGVKASAAARAALEHYIGMSLDDPVHHAVQSQHIAVRDLSLTLGGKGVRPQVGDGAVVVPLDIIDIRAVEDAVDALDQIVLHFFSADVEHELVAAADSFSSRDLHRPFRMRSVKLAVAAYHLRLNPDTELETEFTDFVADAFNTVRKFLLVGIPVT